MLSLVSRRCAQKPSIVARAAIAHPEGEALKASTFVPPACKIFAGEMPSHYVPANDDVKSKASSRYQTGWSSHFQKDYNPSKYYYGRVDGKDARAATRQMFAESDYLKHKGREYGIVALFLAPMMMMSYSARKREAEGKKNPQPVNRGPISAVGRYTFAYVNA